MSKKDEKQDNSNKPKKKERYKPWKWAFVLLLLFNLLVGGYILTFFLPSQGTPTITEPVERTQKNEEAYDLMVEVSPAELSRVMNDYIDSISQGESTLSLSIDEYINVSGTTDILTLEVPYQIKFTPRTLVNGNLKLEVVDFEISNLSIPVSLVMNIIDRQLDWPEWITINTENETVLIMFNQLIIAERVQILVEKVDLVNNDIRFKVLVNDEIFFHPNNRE